MNEPTMTVDQVRDMFSYENGVLYWRVKPSQGVKAGALAGTPARGNHCVVYQGENITRARLVWAWHRGEWPSGVVRHLDGDPLNDRIENLQDAAAPERLRRNPLPGVRIIPGADGRQKFRTAINATFSSAEEAHAAYTRAHAAIYGAASPYATGVSKCL